MKYLSNKLLISLVMTLIFHSTLVYADLASPHVIHEYQPDGTAIELYIKGNHAFHWQEDTEGYTVIREQGNRGRFVYAKLGSDGQLVPTSYELGKANPKALGLQPRILPSSTVRAKLSASGPAGQSGTDASVGQTILQASTLQQPQTLKNLVVLVRFSDHQNRNLPTDSNIDVLMNAVGGDANLAPAGSLRDIYLKNSHGVLTIDSTVVAWATVSQSESYYAAANSGLTSQVHQALAEALTIVDGQIDFSQFDQNNDGYIDAITFLHSGYGAEWGGTDAYGGYYTDRIWSHKWSLYSLPGGAWQSSEGVKVYNYHISPSVWGVSGNTIGRIGVIAHETGHFLGLPDLYDTDSTAGEGIGSWCLMANSWGGDGSQQPPPLLSAWSKIQLGWLTPSELAITGNYALNASQAFNEAYKITTGFPSNEYLLLENRQRTDGNNRTIDNIPPSGDGLLVYHIDDLAGYNIQGYPGQTGWPSNGNHYRVAVLQADALYNLEKGNNRGDSGDSFRAGGVDSIGVSTTLNTDSYQAGNVYPTGNIISAVTAAGTSMAFDFNAGTVPSYQLSVTKTGAGAGTVTSNPDGISCGSTCSASLTYGTNLILTAQPNQGSKLSSWSGACSGSASTCNVYIGSDKQVTANFATIQLPAPPSSVKATALKGRKMSLTWTDTSSNESGFKIERSTDSTNWSQIAIVGANSKSYSNSGLIAGTSYTYRVRAYNADGNSDYSTSNTIIALR